MEGIFRKDNLKAIFLLSATTDSSKDDIKILLFLFLFGLILYVPVESSQKNSGMSRRILLNSNLTKQTIKCLAKDTRQCLQ